MENRNPELSTNWQVKEREMGLINQTYLNPSEMTEEEWLANEIQLV
jgi:hypothetical protein